MNHATTDIRSHSISTVECEDGYSLQYRVWSPADDPLAALFLVSGMMSHSGWFGTLASFLSESHVKVIGADRRSSGLNEKDRGNALSRHMLVSDFLRIVEQEDCGAPIYLVGWCWGAALAINAALELGCKVSGVALLAPGLFPSERIRDAMRRDSTQLHSTQLSSGQVQSPLTPEMFTDIFEFQKYIANDDLAVRTFTTRFIQVSQQMQLVAITRLTHLICPVLLLLAAKDQTVDNPRTLVAFQKLPAATLTCATLSCNHGMQFEAPQELATRITEWVQRTARPHQGMR